MQLWHREDVLFNDNSADFTLCAWYDELPRSRGERAGEAAALEVTKQGCLVRPTEFEAVSSSRSDELKLLAKAIVFVPLA